MQDLETGQRGYVLTGKEEYLEPYQAGLLTIDPSILRVLSLTSDNLNQQRRLTELRPLLTEKTDELSRTINLRRNVGFDAAQSVVMDDTGKLAMDQIRVVIGEMVAEEQRLLVERTDAAIVSAWTTKSAIAVGAWAAIALLGGIAFFAAGRDLH